MQGKIGGDDTKEDFSSKVIKEIESLRKDISDLTKRKFNLQAEIDRIILEAKKVLEDEYQAKKKDLEITYSSQFGRLEQEKTAIQKDKAFVVEQDAKNIAREKELKAIAEDQTAITLNNISGKDALDRQQASNEKYIKEETEKLKEAQAAIVKEVEKLSVRAEELGLLSDSLANKQLALSDRIISLDTKDLELADIERSLNVSQGRLDNLEKSVQGNIAATADAKDRAEKELSIAEEKHKQATDELTAAQSSIQSNKDLGDRLSAWRDELTEKDATLREKEKAQILKDREIDGKLATLKKLRGE